LAQCGGWGDVLDAGCDGVSGGVVKD